MKINTYLNHITNVKMQLKKGFGKFRVTEDITKNGTRMQPFIFCHRLFALQNSVLILHTMLYDLWL